MSPGPGESPGRESPGCWGGGAAWTADKGWWRSCCQSQPFLQRYEEDGDTPRYYRNISAKDPRRSRKQREYPTTAVHIQISEPWFTGSAGEEWLARDQIAQALRRHLSYQGSIALPDLGAQVDNIFIATPRGFHMSNNSIAVYDNVYDNVYGGLGLVGALYQDIQRYARQLTMGSGSERVRARVMPDHAERFRRWVERGQHDPQARPEEPGPGTWWRVIRPGSAVETFDQDRSVMVQGTIERCLWQEAIVYQVETPTGPVMATDHQVTITDANVDYHLWMPSKNIYEEIQTDYDNP